MNLLSLLLIIQNGVHFSEILFSIDQIVWCYFAEQCFPHSLHHFVEFTLCIGFQMSERCEILRNQLKIVIGNNAVFVDIENVVQCAHFTTPEFTFTLLGRIEKKIQIIIGNWRLVAVLQIQCEETIKRDNGRSLLGVLDGIRYRNPSPSLNQNQYLQSLPHA